MVQHSNLRPLGRVDFELRDYRGTIGISAVSPREMFEPGARLYFPENLDGVVVGAALAAVEHAPDEAIELRPACVRR